MNNPPNRTLLCTGIAALVSAVNWEYSTVTKTGNLTTSTAFDGAGFVVLAGVIALFFLSRSIYKSLRFCLDKGIRVPSSIRFFNFWPCAFLVPMLVHFQVSSTQTLSSGETITHSKGYGSDLTTQAIILTVLTIAAIQFSSGLSYFLRNGQTQETSSC